MHLTGSIQQNKLEALSREFASLPLNVIGTGQQILELYLLPLLGINVQQKVDHLLPSFKAVLLDQPEVTSHFFFGLLGRQELQH